MLAPLANPDLWWHLSAGRYIVETRSLPRADFLSHTMAGRPWVDFEWLQQVLWYAAYSAAGCGAFLALRWAAFLGVWASCAAGLRLHGWRAPGQALAVALLAAALFPVSDFRADNVSVLAFSVLLYALEARRLDRWRPRGAWWAAFAAGFALWANMHLAFLYGLALIGCYLAGELIDAWLPVVYGRGPAGRHDRARDFAVLLALGLGATMLNPYSARLYEVLVAHRRDLLLLQETISEWTMPEVGLPYLRPYWAVMALSFSAALWHFVRTRRTPPAHLLALCGFALASASHVRHLPYMALTGLLLAGAAAAQLPIPRRLLTRGGALLAAALAFHVLGGILPACLPWKQLCLRNGEALASFLERNADALGGRRLFNQWGDGGYLGFRLRGANPVYFDGRYIFHELLFETRAAFRDASAWRRLMDEKGVEVALFRRLASHGSRETLPLPGGGRRAVARPFFVRYMPREEWALVHWDEHDLVMVRRSAVDKEWLAAREYKWLWPDDWDRLDWQLKSGRAPKREVLAEAERAGRETPALRPALEPLRAWLTALP